MKKLMVLIVFLLTSHAFGADHYFSNSTGNDTTGDGTTGTPWQTITKVNAECGAGDNCYFLRGDTWTIGSGEYGIFVEHNATESSPTVYSAYGSGALPIIDASAQTGDGDTVGTGGIENCFYLTGSNGSWVTIEYFDIRAATNERAISAKDDYSDRQYVTIQNCTISGSGFSGDGLVNIHGDYTHIYNNYFDNSAQAAYNIGVEISATLSAPAISNIISGNTFVGLGHLGGAIRLVFHDGTIVEKNYIVGCSPNGNQPAGYTGIVLRGPIYLTGGPGYVVVRNNVVDLTDVATETSCTSGNDCAYGINSWTIHEETNDVDTYILNNTFIGLSTGTGVKFQGNSDTGIWQQGTIRNNILYGWDIGIEIDSYNLAGGNFTLYNNNYYGCNNYWDNESTPSVLTDNGGSQSGNPNFAGGSGAEAFALTASSTSCIDLGVSGTYVPSDDYLGNTRSTVDIGAFEYIGEDTTPPTLGEINIQASGLTTQFVGSENWAVGADGYTNFDTLVLSGGSVTLSGCSITGDIVECTNSRQVAHGETFVSFEYTQPGDGLQDTATTPNNLASIVTYSGAFTNNVPEPGTSTIHTVGNTGPVNAALNTGTVRTITN